MSARVFPFVSGPMDRLFELSYTCETDEGEFLESAEACGIEVCLDASTNPHASEVTYQVWAGGCDARRVYSWFGWR